MFLGQILMLMLKMYFCNNDGSGSVTFSIWHNKPFQPPPPAEKDPKSRRPLIEQIIDHARCFPRPKKGDA